MRLRRRHLPWITRAAPLTRISIDRGARRVARNCTKFSALGSALRHATSSVSMLLCAIDPDAAEIFRAARIARASPGLYAAGAGGVLAGGAGAVAAADAASATWIWSALAPPASPVIDEFRVSRPESCSGTAPGEPTARRRARRRARRAPRAPGSAPARTARARRASASAGAGSPVVS